MAVAVHIRVRALLSAAVHATTSYEPLSLGGFSSSFCPRLKSKITISMTQPEDADADADAIWEAIEHGREALAACPEGHPDRGQLAADLGMILYPGYCRFGDITLIKEGIKVQREVLDLCPRGHPDRSPICANLGVFLCEYYTQSGDIAVLDEAIELQREALVLLPPDHPDREFVCTSLGKSLHTRYGQCSDINLLDKAIELLREALKLRPPGHLMRAASCEILAASIYARYKQCDNTTFLDEAIELGQEALILRPSSHPLRATTLGHFGCFLHSRFEEGGRSDLTLLNKAIELDREALALQPAGHPSQASSLANLGSSLHTLFEHCGDVTLLNEAVELKRAALALQPLGHPDRSNFCTVLSTSLIKAYKQTKDAALLDEVIELCGYASRSAAPWQPMHALLNLAEIHLIPDTSYFSLAKALQYLDLSFPSHVDQIQGFISHAIYTLSQHWSLDIVMTAENILLLCQIYVKIIDRLPLAAGFVLDTSSRLQTLKSRHYIGTDACVVAALANQPSKAVELLDRAHGLVWTQALHQRDPQIEGAPSGLASELAVLLREISAPLTTQPGDLSYAHHQDRRYRQSTRIQALLREIRAMPGVERFMLGKTYDTLRAAAREHPVVVLAAGRGHAFALIMSSATEDQPRALHLDLTSDDLQSIQSAAQDAGLRSRADIREGDGLDARIGYKTSGLHVHHKPFRVLAKIWHKIVKPVIDYLKLERATGRSRPRLHWCTNGGFVFLPLHAAGIYQGPASAQVCCSDYLVSSYTPTVSALLRAQAQAALVISSEVDMLLVGEDCAKNPALNRLWSVRRELKCIELVAKSQQFGRAVEVIGSAATVQQVTEQVKSASFLHLACHGIQDQTNALESGFYLSDGKLTISKLMDLQLEKPWLAYLSACETAKGDAKQPDQVMHLAAAMLFAGFKHVIATMWVMGDADGPDLAKWFYEVLMSNEIIDADAVAYALDSAVRKLREKEVSP